MSLTRSGSTLVWLLPSGSRYWPAPGSPSGICFNDGAGFCPGARGTVGVQLTYFSPISDCGRISQLASSRKSWKPASAISSSMIALPGTLLNLPSSIAVGSPGSETLTDLICPTLAPATRTCSPLTMNEPWSKIARTT